MGKQSGMPEGIKIAMGWAIGIGSIALILLIMLILFGNLSGNVGFASGTQGYNDTQNVITNYSKSATNLSEQFPVVGTIIGIALLLVVLIGILLFAIRKKMGITGGVSSGSNQSFG